MQAGQAVRRLNAWARARWAALRLPAPRLRWPGRVRARQLAVIGVGCVIAYYGLGALFMSHIDDDAGFAAPDRDLLDGESYSVASAVALLQREVNRYGWVSNDPFFLPTALLKDMGQYQTGIVEGLAHFAQSLSAVLATDGKQDSDLAAAADRLARPGTVWMWDLSQPLAFLGRSEDQYREGLVALQAYNVAVADGDSRFPKTPQALRTLLEGVTADLDESAGLLGSEAERAPALFGRQAAHRFYFAKGRAYAHLILMRGLGRDFAAALRPRVSEEDWQGALDALQKAATFRPAFVVNGAPNALLLPSHLVAEGYYVARARSALERVIAKLG